MLGKFWDLSTKQWIGIVGVIVAVPGMIVAVITLHNFFAGPGAGGTGSSTTPSSSRSAPPPGGSSGRIGAITSPGTPAVAAPLSLDMATLTDGTAPSKRGIVTLNGAPLHGSVAFNVGFSDPDAAATYDLGHPYTYFRATVGMSNPGFPGQGMIATLQLVANGETLWTGTVNEGRSTPVVVRFSPTSQLTLVSGVPHSQGGGLDVVWGNAVVSNS
jgi:hypothetical protein